MRLSENWKVSSIIESVIPVMNSTKMTEEILVNLRTSPSQRPVNRNLIRNFLRKTWKAIEAFRHVAGPPEVTVVFVNDRKIRHYNRQFRNRDYPTDVLSFPVNETIEDRYYLGDILISTQTAARQAERKGHCVEKELQVLLLHGMLHLLGYDHETDSGQMRRLETRLQKLLL